MIVCIIVITSIISAALFGLLPIVKNAGTIINFQKKSIDTIKSSTLTDEQKQHLLLSYSGIVFLTTLKLVFFIFILTMPFFIMFYGEYLLFNAHSFYESLTSYTGMLISLTSFFLYYLLKKLYGKFWV